MNRKLSLVMSAVVVCFLGVNGAQINLRSDTINLRDYSGKAKTTTHYGMFNVYAWSAAGGAGGYFQNITTSDYAGGTYGLYPSCLGARSSGVGLRSDGAWRGVMATATYTNSTALARCGGWFTAGYGTTSNYGIYAQTEGSNGSNRAGYFSGDIQVTGQYNPSDVRFKTANQPMAGSLDKILLLKPQTYYYDTLTFKKMHFPSKKQFGLVAQDLEQVFPELVSDYVPAELTMADSTAGAGTANAKPETYKSINYVALVPVLVAAIQEQQKQIADLQATIAAMKK